MVSTYGDGWCDLSFMEIPVPDQYGPAFIFGEVSALTLAKAPFISAARPAASGGEVEQSGLVMFVGPPTPPPSLPDRPHPPPLGTKRQASTRRDEWSILYEGHSLTSRETP